METPDYDSDHGDYVKAKTVHPITLQSMLSETRLNLISMRRTRSIPIAGDMDSDLEKFEDARHPDMSSIENSLCDVSDTEGSELEKDVKPQSIFLQWEKYMIAVLGGFAGFWSSISSPIYVPVLSQIQQSFHVNEAQVNITIVVYSIFQGAGPLLFSSMADSIGRRPIILACLLMYMVINCILAVNTNFAGLVVLRCVQACCIAPTISLGSGVASDITTKAERASFIGLTTGLALLGQAFGAFIGGMISSAFGWRAIFWFLAICAGTTFIVLFILLPETGHSVVGSTSEVLPQKHRWIMLAPIMRTRHFSCRLHRDSGRQEDKLLPPPKKFNLLKPLNVLKQKQAILTLLPASLCYSLWLMMLTSLSHALTKLYGYSLQQVALAYIPCGIGGLLGSLSIGRVLDWSYSRYQKQSQRNGHTFNVLKSRLIVSLMPSTICVIASLIFAWSLQEHGPVALVIIASCLIAYGAMCWLTISSTVVVDLRPTESSGACAIVNLTRCWCAAVFVGCLDNMEQMGFGWCYTLMAALCGVSTLCVVYLYFSGHH